MPLKRPLGQLDKERGEEAGRDLRYHQSKGRIGKTTTAINLAASIAQSGERVLLVDMDPQANASHGLGVRVPGGEPAMLDVLLGDKTIAEVTRPAASQT